MYMYVCDIHLSFCNTKVLHRSRASLVVMIIMVEVSHTHNSMSKMM